MGHWMTPFRWETPPIECSRATREPDSFAVSPRPRAKRIRRTGAVPLRRPRPPRVPPQADDDRATTGNERPAGPLARAPPGRTTANSRARILPAGAAQPYHARLHRRRQPRQALDLVSRRQRRRWWWRMNRSRARAALSHQALRWRCLAAAPRPGGNRRRREMHGTRRYNKHRSTYSGSYVVGLEAVQRLLRSAIRLPSSTKPAALRPRPQGPQAGRQPAHRSLTALWPWPHARASRQTRPNRNLAEERHTAQLLRAPPRDFRLARPPTATVRAPRRKRAACSTAE